MQIAIDRGNTQTKVSMESNGILSDFSVIPDQQLKAELARYIEDYQPTHCIVSDVRSEELTQDLLQYIKIPTLLLSPRLQLPFTISYATSETLGHDRLANAAGAIRAHGNQQILIIDCGTCMTFTFVESRVLIGGSISPGIRMRFKSLHEHTGRLPFLEFDETLETSFLGTSTKQSVEAGVMQGIIAETEGMIAHYRAQYPKIIVIVTGGDASFFEKHLKSSIFAAPLLTQEGLHEILRIHCA